MALLKLSFALFAICFITLVYSRSIDEESKCSKNPEEWCTNFGAAIECNAVKYCIETVWSVLPDHESTNSCSACEQEIENIRRSIGSNVTKEVIETALDYVCELTFVTRVLRKQCEQLIDKYVDSHINELLDLLKSNVDPQTVCSLLDFCSFPQLDLEREDAAVYYDNIVLHVPARSLEIIIDRHSEDNVRPVVIGAKKCTWGPSYWCGNLSTSKECGSTGHCIAKYWTFKQYDEDNDSVCQICKDMVKQARDQLLSNETQEELKEVFEGSCKLIPLKEIRKECITLADEFVPELTEVLASQMNPTAVCTVSGLCNSPRIDNLLATETKTTDLSAMDSCVNCTVAFTSFERFMQSATKEDVLNRMLAMCSELSSYSDLCSSLLVSNFEDIYELLNNQLPPPIACHITSMCAYKYHTHLDIEGGDFQHQVDTMLAVRNDDLPCDLCKQLVHHFKEVLIANTTEEEFLEMLQGICQQTGFEDECLKLVNENYRILYRFFTDELDPTRICTEIQICPRDKNFVSDDNLNLIAGRVIPVLTNDVKLSNLMPVSPQQLATTEQNGDSVECKFCETVIGVIQSELKDPSYENDVRKVLEKVCTLVPSADENRCDEFMDEYADTLIKVLADETDPFVVCRTLKVCPGPQIPSSSNELCPLCQYLLHYIQEALDDPKDETQIENAVKKVCTIIPASAKNKCDEFISQYSALIISILSQEVDPSLVCPAMKLCPSSSPPKERCTHCRIFMVDLIEQLDKNYELDNIKNKVGSLSPIKGLEKSTTALELRVSHYEQLVDMLVAEFDGDEACVYMKFCDVESVSLPLSPAIGNADVETNEIVDSQPDFAKPSCEVCELFVKVYEKELTSNKTEEELEVMLGNFCAKMKNPKFKNNCTTMVKKYVPVFLDLLKKSVSPRELCVAAKLCSLRTLTRNTETECRTCEVAVGSLESVLGDPVIKESVFEHAVKICDRMTGKSHSVCVETITELLPQVEGLVFDIPPWYVCSKMKMCPYSYRVDTSVCSNPKFWCQDTKTAFTCDRLNFCRQNAWASSAP